MGRDLGVLLLEDLRAGGQAAGEAANGGAAGGGARAPAAAARAAALAADATGLRFVLGRRRTFAPSAQDEGFLDGGAAASGGGAVPRT
jgi:hypothetical protein